MIKGMCYLSTNVDAFKEYCSKHEIQMFKVSDIQYAFIMKSKKLEKFMRFSIDQGHKVISIELAD